MLVIQSVNQESKYSHLLNIAKLDKNGSLGILIDCEVKNGGTTHLEEDRGSRHVEQTTKFVWIPGLDCYVMLCSSSHAIIPGPTHDLNIYAHNGTKSLQPAACSSSANIV